MLSPAGAQASPPRRLAKAKPVQRPAPRGLSQVRMMTFGQFFKAATGHAPYDYQQRLAAGGAGRACQSQLIHIPTGLGKTAAVVLAWLWNRLAPATPRHAWPRRLVYCLPLRTLVEQTQANVAAWLARIADECPGKAELNWLRERSPVILMGGEELEPAQRDWDLYPERPCIIIGTQDMLLSRALNRGYGMNRYRWPMHFGLLNNDALWVMDETQLMGVGVETSAQLDGFRHKASDSVVGSCPTWWMSATLEAERLATIDHPKPDPDWPVIQLEAADCEQPQVQTRLHASKPLSPAPVKLTRETQKTYARDLAAFVIEKHRLNTLTLVVLNTVARAREVFECLGGLGMAKDRLALVHSRFRSPDRSVQQAKLLAGGDRIVVATQAVEAGVDVSACLLVTELAPWSSLVQRFGRCNRRGEFAREAGIAWVEVQPSEGKGELARPYDAAELEAARSALQRLDNASPRKLADVAVPERRVTRPVLRRKDLLDLFDTTPDLAGLDLDISRYIRDGEDTDVQVFWRDLQGKRPDPDEPKAGQPELCQVSLPRFRDFLAALKKRKERFDVFTWDSLEEQWKPVDSPRPGGAYLLDIRAGGYSSESGWTGEPANPQLQESWVKPLICPGASSPSGGYSGNESCFLQNWVSLADHTRHVEEETAGLVAALAAGGELPEPGASALRTAARWHDLGKAHAVFQAMLVGENQEQQGTLWAKSGQRAGRCSRRHFRHELASALAWLQAGAANQAERDLVAYLVAAHHGKVRLSIRSLPGEEPPAGFALDTRVARGIVEGDELPAEAFAALELDSSLSHKPLKLNLGLMEMGWEAARGSSWLARMIALRDRLGPFQLAWLEMLLRAADGRASAAEAGPAKRADRAGVSPDMALHEEARPPASTPVLSAHEQSLVAELVADGLSIQDKFRPEPLYRDTGKGYYASQTVAEIRQARKASRPKPKP